MKVSSDCPPTKAAPMIFPSLLTKNVVGYPAVYSMIVTFIILKVYGSITNIKPKDEDVVKGLDSTLLDEKAYDIM